MRSIRPAVALQAVALLAGLLSACGGTKSAATSSAGAEGSRRLTQRCGPPARTARVVTLRTSDGVHLDGAVVGAGSRGVVFVHEAGGRALCGWWPYANRLGGAGFQALLFDLRCYGLSACPQRGADASSRT